MNLADRRMVGTVKMKFLRYAAGYTCKDQACNDNIRQRLGIFNLNDRIQQNKKNWHKHCYAWIRENLPNKFYNKDQ